MANTIQHKRSATASAIPTAGSLVAGELAVNTADGKLFMKKDNATVVEIGASGGGAAAAGTLTGTTLAAGVTLSSLTTLGTIAHLTATYVNSCSVGVKNTNGTVLGSNALGSSSYGGCTAIGYSALQFSNGGSNIGIGQNSGYGAGTTFTHNLNVFVGNNCGQYSHGLNNVAMGSYSLFRVTGQDSVAIGTSSCVNSNATNGTGTRNTAIGAQTISSGSGIGITGTDNCAGGYQSTKALTSGTYNSAWGTGSLLLITTGAQNSCLGYQAGDSITTGNNNTILGAGADVQASTDINSIVIGKSAGGIGSHGTVIGNNNTVATKIFGVQATGEVAPTIASAATIAPTKQITFVSGTTAIDTITAPTGIATTGGQITIIPTGIFTTTAAGNIALASTAVVSRALIMTYDATTTKWYPSY